MCILVFTNMDACTKNLQVWSQSTNYGVDIMTLENIVMEMVMVVQVVVCG